LESFIIFALAFAAGFGFMSHVDDDRNKEPDMHTEEAEALRVLAAARAAIEANHGRANELDVLERERRVAIYAGQISRHGRIVDGLPASGVRPAYLSRRSRFVTGDALGRRCVG
jgi:hypothetical protein